MIYYEWSGIQRGIIALRKGKYSHLYFLDGMFRGWDFWVILLTATNSLGGLLIAMVIKYADNILKAYAQVSFPWKIPQNPILIVSSSITVFFQSGAIVGAVVGSWLIFGIVPSFFFMIGAILVMISIVIYSSYPYRAPADEQPLPVKGPRL